MLGAAWRLWSPHSWESNRNMPGPLYQLVRRLAGRPFRATRKMLADRLGNSVLAEFESLGDNCEFGMAQREHGVEPLGLFRFATISLDGLIAILESGLSFARSPESVNAVIELRSSGADEFIISVEQYDFRFHTFVSEHRADIDKVRDFESKRLTLLARKLLDDLEDSRKIFVYKSHPTAPREKIDALVACLRRFGPNSLLWVTTPEPDRPAGFVETLGDGLMRGYIDKFALYDRSPDISRSAWGALCREAYALRRHQLMPAAA
jgi:hypothetical protein